MSSNNNKIPLDIQLIDKITEIKEGSKYNIPKVAKSKDYNGYFYVGSHYVEISNIIEKNLILKDDEKIL